MVPVGDRTNATDEIALDATGTGAGVLRPDELARFVDVEHDPAGAAVSRWVENHWSLRWDLPEGRSFLSQVVPSPACSLTVELGSHRRPDVPEDDPVVVTGLVTHRFDVDVRGWGRVLGVKFRPGGLTALTGLPASGWTDRVVPARRVLSPDLAEVLRDPDLVAVPDEWRATAEEGLLAVAPGPDPRYDLVLAIVADVLTDRTLLTSAQVAARHGLTPRSLQRLFTHFVGIGPKWVLARFRMHDVITELDEGFDGPLTELAHRYGWYDQAHFIRDFTARVGVTPGRYRDRRTGPADPAGGDRA